MWENYVTDADVLNVWKLFKGWTKSRKFVWKTVIERKYFENGKDI